MEHQTSRARYSAGALCLALSGVLFVLYPAIRPFSDEVTLNGAEAFSSGRWILAHVLAMLAFTLLIMGLLSLWLRLRGTPVDRLVLRSLVVCWFGVGLLLPFYGAEAFGLHAIGQYALSKQDVALVGLANDVRTGPGLPIFVLGLLVLAVGTIMIAVAAWKSRMMARWSGVPLAAGFVLYLPQFAASQPLRVIHGAIIAASCLWIASYLWKRQGEQNI
ncbi:MAG: hypothetical protein PVH52_05030 [bacterium]|jgi:hypothetical protein